MGREIRMVPEGWEHPRRDDGRYQPMFDETWSEALTTLCDLIQTTIDAINSLDNAYCYADHHDELYIPDPAYYWPADWENKPRTHFQVYETVSEGTPVSPVFASPDEVVNWLQEQGVSEQGARAFVKMGWSPSGFMVPGKDIAVGLAALEYLPQEDE